ncbi:regulator of G-protein signaling 20 [Pituophis catenifer annectens]|uniref:regulator of G-protein signaling 20 n=1 Tax=Pituophis catenifer annectens TaxID=94852 RepID=UPI003991F9ED
MGSEQVEMRKRQTSASQGIPSSLLAQAGVETQGSNPCCFCWCCCCSCSCLAVRNQDESTRAAAHEIASEMIPYCEQGSTPSLEEASAWRHSFDKLMATPSGRNAFREFLRSEYSEENMLFWLACEDLKQESNKNVIDEKVRRIYEDYVSILSPREVSLDSRARGIINRNIMEPSIHTFDEAQFQVYMLMLRDSYPRFVNSAIYKELVMSHFQATAES